MYLSEFIGLMEVSNFLSLEKLNQECKWKKIPRIYPNWRFTIQLQILYTTQTSINFAYCAEICVKILLCILSFRINMFFFTVGHLTKTIMLIKNILPFISYSNEENYARNACKNNSFASTVLSLK